MLFNNDCKNNQNNLMHIKARDIAQRWLDELAFSAATWDLESHMALVSRQVKVLGLPGVKVVDYPGWLNRRSNEFSKKLLRSLSYRLVNILLHEEDNLLFTVIETIKSSRGQVFTVDKAINLRLEDDGIWRVVQERIDRIEIN